jgi:allantoate deiminase
MFMINKDRLATNLLELSQIGKLGEVGVKRLAHSQEDREAVDLVREWMESAGLDTRIDHFGNLIGRLSGENEQAPILMLGSHIDTQPAGGRFDGTVGVLGALEVVQTLIEQKIDPIHPIEVIAFTDEEGCRFNKGLFGSRGIIGEVENSELEQTDKQGVTRKQALEEFGCDPRRLQESVYPRDSIYAFLEMHIEQGPVLEEADQPAGIVTGISGPLWLTVSFEGFAGHAGSVPMALRKDALVGASEVIANFHELVKEFGSKSSVGTVGSLSIQPDSRNVIPNKVEFTIDLRDINQECRDKCEQLLLKVINETAEKHQLKAHVREDMRSEPRYCADWIQKIMNEEADAIGLKAPLLMSGPFHDALSLSNVCDFGMIFVRCRDGISHNPLEFAEMDDIAKGTELLYQTVLRISQ